MLLRGTHFRKGILRRRVKHVRTDFQVHHQRNQVLAEETGLIPDEGLRKRILELWNDPEKCKEMGRKGREHCEKYFTHEHYIRRNLRLALVVFDEYCKETD